MAIIYGMCYHLVSSQNINGLVSVYESYLPRYQMINGAHRPPVFPRNSASSLSNFRNYIFREMARAEYIAPSLHAAAATISDRIELTSLILVLLE